MLFVCSKYILRTSFALFFSLWKKQGRGKWVKQSLSLFALRLTLTPYPYTYPYAFLSSKIALFVIKGNDFLFRDEFHEELKRSTTIF